MQGRRFLLAERHRDAGLPPPKPATVEALRLVLDGGVLGASRHVALAHGLLADLARAPADPVEAWRTVEVTAALIAETRGVEAPVVANAVRWLLDAAAALPPAERPSAVAARAEAWQEESRIRLERLVEGAVARLGSDCRLLVFDYSSTVAAVVLALHAKALRPRLLIPESRSIAGGRRYLEAFSAAGLDAAYLLDAAMDWALERSDAVLLGAESLRADGGLVNTIGSRAVARLAACHGVPVYGCSDLFKLDHRSYRGGYRLPEARGFDDLLLAGLDLPAGSRVDTTQPELEVVPPGLLTALLTEHGPVPPQALWHLGRATEGATEPPP